MAAFKCKMCGGELDIQEGATIAKCLYCRSKQTLPKLDDDRRANMYDRANFLRRNNEFDKAMGIYDQILNEDNTDAEAYWSILLCEYGIEYVRDPATGDRVPTVHRAQYTSIFDDANYKAAIERADFMQREIYEEEAKAINEIQKGILAISQNEKPFDVFICYKETDSMGERTRDSVIAQELYYELTEAGFKVFFARITLENKLGSAYEPYIFAALNSAKVMVVLGTKAEHFNAVWVRNEWSRFLSLTKTNHKKMLIPAYRDMDPYELPPEFSHLQAQDMSKLGFMQDLLHGIKKIIDADKPKVVKETTVINAASSSNANVAPLLKRVTIFLDGQDWSSANAYCEKVLDIDPENGLAYLYKLMSELKVSREDRIPQLNYKAPLDNVTSYKNAVRFADESTATRLIGYNNQIKARLAEAERIRKEEERLALERRQAEERERRERERIAQEQRQKAEQRRRELAALNQAKTNATNLITAQIREKENTQALITKKENEALSSVPGKMRFNGLLAILCPIIFWFSLVMVIVAATEQNDNYEAQIALFVILLIASLIFTIVSNVKILKNEDKTVGWVFLNYFYLIYSIVLGTKTVKKYSKNNRPQYVEEINSLKRQLVSLESQINDSRRSLSEINQKIDEFNSRNN